MGQVGIDGGIEGPGELAAAEAIRVQWALGASGGRGLELRLNKTVCGGLEGCAKGTAPA